MLLNRSGILIMNLKVYEKIIWMFELGATHLLKLKGTPLVHPKGVHSVVLLVVPLMKDCFQTNPLKLTKLN